MFFFLFLPFPPFSSIEIPVNRLILNKKEKAGAAAIMIQVIDRVFNILEHLRDSQVLSLSCLAKRMGLNKSTLCNILKTMTDLGYVENDGSGNYRISEKFKQLAQPLPQEELLKSQCTHFCKMLADETQESGVITALRGHTLSILAQSQYPRSLMISMTVYENLSLFHSVSGRIILAHMKPSELDEIIDLHGYPETEWNNISTHAELENACRELRNSKISIMTNHTDGIKAFAMPVFDAKNRICGAAGLTVPLFRLDHGKETEILNSLRECVAKLSLKNINLNLTSKTWRLL